MLNLPHRTKKHWIRDKKTPYIVCVTDDCKRENILFYCVTSRLLVVRFLLINLFGPITDWVSSSCSCLITSAPPPLWVCGLCSLLQAVVYTLTITMD